MQLQKILAIERVPNKLKMGKIILQKKGYLMMTQNKIYPNNN
jgi:hypothetical protein